MWTIAKSPLARTPPSTVPSGQPSRQYGACKKGESPFSVANLIQMGCHGSLRGSRRDNPSSSAGLRESGVRLSVQHVGRSPLPFLGITRQYNPWSEALGRPARKRRRRATFLQWRAWHPTHAAQHAVVSRAFSSFIFLNEWNNNFVSGRQCQSPSSASSTASETKEQPPCTRRG